MCSTPVCQYTVITHMCTILCIAQSLNMQRTHYTSELKTDRHLQLHLEGIDWFIVINWH